MDGHDDAMKPVFSYEIRKAGERVFVFRKRTVQPT
jgi:hypothetical protein